MSGKVKRIKERAIQIAKDPQVQITALEIANIAKYGIRRKKTRRIVGKIIKAARKKMSN